MLVLLDFETELVFIYALWQVLNASCAQLLGEKAVLWLL